MTANAPPDAHSTTCPGRARRPRIWPMVATFVTVLTGAVSPASGQSPDGEDDAQIDASKPWYKDVSTADKDSARALFAQGARLHQQKQYAEAVSKYRAALEYWDNPDIHFNLVQAYIALDQPLEAYASLEQATRYGLDFMTAKDRVRARDYQRLLESHLVSLTVRCEQPGVNVALDSKLLFTGPGSDTRWVLPKPHEIFAARAEYLDYKESLSLEPGEPREVTIELIPRSRLARVAVSCAEPEAEVTLDDEALMVCPGRVEKELMSGQTYTVAIERPGYLGEQKTVTPEPRDHIDVTLRTTTIELQPRLRWSRWLPLSVVTAGLAVGIVGGVMQNQAVDNMAAYDSEIDTRCGPPVHGCDPDMVPAEVADLKTSAEQQNRLGVTMMIAGGAIIAGGLTLVFLNKPRARRVEKPSEPAPTVIPTVSREGVGIATRFRF